VKQQTHGVHGKAVLYAVAAFLTPFSDTLCPILFGGVWPKLQSVVGCAIAGTLSTAIVLRAFYDGSYQRHLETKNGNGNGKEIQIKP